MRDRGPATRLLLVYCGGTFGMRETGVGLAAQTDLGDVLSALVDASSRRHGRPVDWRLAVPRSVIDSAAAGHGTALEIADLIRERVAEGISDGPVQAVIVVHGTDTLAHSAAQTAFALADLAIPIVFTGAQRPIGTPASDAERNFDDAFREAMSGGEPGVRLVFGGAALPACRAVKRSSEAFDAFVARRPAARPVDGVGAELAAALAACAHAAAPRVGMLTMVPGLPAELLQAALDAFPDGLVLECYGSGTGPLVGSVHLAALRRARDAGTPVLAITRCEDGAVDLPRYAVGAAMAAVGVIGGHDLTAEAAIAKLRALRRAGLSGAELRSALDRNLVGEQQRRVPAAAG
ncbi:asparaginase domain-containing protein [Leucobacter chromiiresistens]|uniref:Asparaginase n=1 Tax=Leucobacter chromiiresistens TaxID=1079994 RepID=A0A147EQU9_9MICO|nr:asparaginase domain-containing protein [Leucobacter chromiiresistens]KTR86757.1 hypothetical protein NS354_03195 [Leucobacter chromiiresistens]